MSESQIFVGDCQSILQQLPARSVRCCITSPPYYGLRDYGITEQVGSEITPTAYVNRLVEIFHEVHRVLTDDGTLWLNLGDSYNSPPVGRFNGGGFKDTSARTGGRDLTGVATSGKMNKQAASGLPPKNLLGIPWRVALALQADGWVLRSDIIWHKPSVMPESVRDRPTRDHEYMFLLTKQARYYYDGAAIREPVRVPAGRAAGETRNKRTVWTIPTQCYRGAHFAVYPTTLVEPCLLAGSAPGDTVLDPFVGSGTTGVVALQQKRNFIGIDINPDFAEMARQRIATESRLA